MDRQYQRPIPFDDRYRILDLLAIGGMAEIYMAQRETAIGVPKPVVIKRLKPALALDERAVRLFADEARISTLLGHPTVVQVFDIGEVGGVPYIVMEHIDGEELNQLARRGLAVGNFLPMHLAVEVVRQAALALGYCHALRDERGTELELVHCDVSPNNLLVTREGNVKLIDFGIARFVGQHHMGDDLVPGKLSYMSPEQVTRSRLDARSDIFALGVILYEMTLGQRLFRGAAREVKERIARCDIQPPTFVDHDYPGHLEAIVMKALERHPSERHHSAYELADELAGYLVAAGRSIGAVELARYLDELSAREGGERRDELQLAEPDADELDFDRDRSSDAERPSSVPELSAWDEPEEAVTSVAAALGIEVELVRQRSRAPTSDFGLFMAERDADAQDAAGDEAREEANDQAGAETAGETQAVARVAAPAGRESDDEASSRQAEDSAEATAGSLWSRLWKSLR